MYYDIIQQEGDLWGSLPSGVVLQFQAVSALEVAALGRLVGGDRRLILEGLLPEFVFFVYVYIYM